MAGQSATWQDTSGAENLIRINREFGKSLEWLAEVVVSRELFSAKFPANREKYREFCHFGPYLRKIGWINGNISMGYGGIPYSKEQGIFSTDQGSFWRDQGIYRTDQGSARFGRPG